MKKPLSELLRRRLDGVAARGRVMGQALKVRADMAATRRRLKAAYAEIGEEVHGCLAGGEPLADERLRALAGKVDGIQAELKLLEQDLRQILRPAPTPDPAPDAPAGGDGIEYAGGEPPENPQA